MAIATLNPAPADDPVANALGPAHTLIYDLFMAVHEHPAFADSHRSSTEVDHDDGVSLTIYYNPTGNGHHEPGARRYKIEVDPEGTVSQETVANRGERGWWVRLNAEVTEPTCFHATLRRVTAWLDAMHRLGA